MSKIQIDAPKGATVDFFTYTLDEIEYFEFDTSLCGPPEPMVNGMLGLQLLKAPHQKLVMINMHEPKGLYSKVKEDYSWTVESIENSNLKIIFSPINVAVENSTNFNDNTCGGS